MMAIFPLTINKKEMMLCCLKWLFKKGGGEGGFLVPAHVSRTLKSNNKASRKNG